MEPVTQNEILLAAAADGQTELPDPVTRKEMFLAKAAGMAVEPPEPVTREEMFLSRIGGGGTSGGIPGAKPMVYFELDAEQADDGTIYFNVDQIQTVIDNGMNIVIQSTNMVSGNVTVNEEKYFMKKEAMCLITPSGLPYNCVPAVGYWSGGGQCNIMMKLDPDALENDEEIIQSVYRTNSNRIGLLSAYAVSF